MICLFVSQISLLKYSFIVFSNCCFYYVHISLYKYLHLKCYLFLKQFYLSIPSTQTQQSRPKFRIDVSNCTQAEIDEMIEIDKYVLFIHFLHFFS